MRTSTTIGLIALISLVACATPLEVEHIHGDSSGDADGDGVDDGTSTDTDGTDPSGDASDPDAPPSAAVDGLTISKISVYQAVQVDVMKDGDWVSRRNAPLVANRPALVRVFVTPDSGWSSQSVTAELRLASSDQKFPIVSKSLTVSKASTDSDTKSTFNLEVPADSLPQDATFTVTLTAKGATNAGKSPARFPEDGTPKSLGLQVSGKVRVVVVPVKYMADGSGRTPDITASQLELYKDIMMARYPATDVEVTARAPWTYNSTISGGGSGFSQVLTAVTQLRRSDGVSGDVYYYGALAPASSFNSFCQGGCVTGLSTVVDDPQISQLRASVGIGFSGYDSANTMAHEVGHAHGRNHAPCGGAQGVDPDFPSSSAYGSGGIGVWGYNIIDKTFISPTKGKDMMGYCSPEWVSDYTYAGLFDRVSAIAQAYPGSKAGAPSSGGSKTFRMATIDETGAMSWTETYTADAEPTGGQARTVRFMDASGATVGTHTARFFPYDHLPGGVVVMPSEPVTTSRLGVSPRAWSQVKVDGVARALAR
jgi:hypothetical protein